MTKEQDSYQELLQRYKGDVLTKWAIKAKQCLKEGKKAKYRYWVDKITDRMDPKFRRLEMKADKGQILSPFDPVNHLISQEFKMGFADWLVKEGGDILIIEEVLDNYDPKRGPFLPYADQTIYFYYLKNFKEYLYREDSRCIPLGGGRYNKSKYFKRRAFLYESSVRKKLEKAFSLLPLQRRKICTLRYLKFLKTAAIAEELHITQATVRVTKKKALSTLREKAPDMYDLCARFDKL